MIKTKNESNSDYTRYKVNSKGFICDAAFKSPNFNKINKSSMQDNKKLGKH